MLENSVSNKYQGIVCLISTNRKTAWAGAYQVSRDSDIGFRETSDQKEMKMLTRNLLCKIPKQEKHWPKNAYGTKRDEESVHYCNTRSVQEEQRALSEFG